MPRHSKYRRPIPDAADTPTNVSSSCLIGEHDECTGKVALADLDKGKRYVRCRCPVCDHPPIRTMPLKDDD